MCQHKSLEEHAVGSIYQLSLVYFDLIYLGVHAAIVLHGRQDAVTLIYLDVHAAIVLHGRQDAVTLIPTTTTTTTASSTTSSSSSSQI
jgi:hypothetical protein